MGLGQLVEEVERLNGLPNEDRLLEELIFPQLEVARNGLENLKRYQKERATTTPYSKAERVEAAAHIVNINSGINGARVYIGMYGGDINFDSQIRDIIKDLMYFRRLTPEAEYFFNPEESRLLRD